MQNTTNFKKMLVLFLFMVAATVKGEDIEIKLWQDNMPYTNGDLNDVPSMKIFFPNESKSVNRIILMIPGGEYDGLNLNKEGYDWVPFLKKEGITVAVLKYRMPKGNPNVPIADTERAMTILRENSKKWNIREDGIGVMGFSAGGHIASYMSTHYKDECKPDFQILFYPIITMIRGFANNEVRKAFLGDSPKKKVEKLYSSDMHVTRITPKALIMLCDDDTVIAPSNGTNYYSELYRHDVPASLYVFPSGGHGWGIDDGFDYHIEMELLLKAWLESL